MAISEREPMVSTILNREFRLLIGGGLAGSEDNETLVCRDPATQEVLASVPNAGPRDVDRAVAAAWSAFPAWRSLAMSARQDVLLAIAQVIEEASEDFAMLDTLDTGNVIAAMRADASLAVWNIKHAVALSNDIKGEVSHLDRNLHYTRRDPFGVVARLLAFNHPIAGLAGALGPPLLTGNCVILKPSPHTPLSALFLAEAIADLAPPGVINILSGENERVALPLLKHPGIRRIALTCSAEAARGAMALASETLKTVTYEGGGKNPLIVFPDMDPDIAASIAVAGMSLPIQGQSCASTSRVLVHESIREAFTEALAAKFEALKIGLPTVPASDIGALTHKGQYEKTLHYIEAGKAAGARLITGGERPLDPALAHGFFVTPTVFDRVDPTMAIAQEEIFGPVVSVLSWSDFEAMIDVANGTIYGLTAVIATNDLDTAVRAADAVEAGYVEINGPISFAAGSPFGGVKQSGIGREYTIDDHLSYTQIKSVNVNLR